MQQMTMFGLNQPEKIEKTVKYKEFTYASAFAGIGGMTMGLESLGGKGVIAWEYDPSSSRQYAQEAHKLLHPNIPVGGDICAVDTNKLVDFDVLCFTPPCQSFSVAGKRGGFEDTRGTLTFEALRIAKAKKPKALFMENVKGLVNHDNGNTMSVIINAINEIGYTVDFNVLNSKYFDVAQNRERVYLIAIRNDLIAGEPWINVKGNTMLPKAKNKYMNRGAATFNFDWPKEMEVKTKISDFLEKEVDSKYYLSEDKKIHLLSISDECQNAPYIMDTRQKSADKKSGKSGVRVSDTICPAITASEQKDVKKVVEKVHYIGTYDKEKTRSNGKPKYLEVYGVLNENGQSQTLKTGSGGNQQPKIMDYENYRIRKLTPRECLRLQSVPENKIDLLLENFSDSRNYKFAGNGLTTNVIKAIGEKLLKYL